MRKAFLTLSLLFVFLFTYFQSLMPEQSNLALFNAVLHSAIFKDHKKCTGAIAKPNCLIVVRLISFNII